MAQLGSVPTLQHGNMLHASHRPNVQLRASRGQLRIVADTEAPPPETRNRPKASQGLLFG